MPRIRNYLFGCILIPLTLAAGWIDRDAKSRMCCELDTIHHMIEVKYAPVEWKKEHLGWDLESESVMAKTRIMNSCRSVKDFQGIIYQFFQRMHDFHVSVHFYSTELSFIPISVKGVNGHYYIVDIDSEIVDVDTCPFQNGDELLLVDNLPVANYVKQREMALFGGSSPTQKSLTESTLFMYSGARGDSNIPDGEITLTLRSNTTGQLTSCIVDWMHLCEMIPTCRGLKEVSFLEQHPLLNKELKVPFVNYSPRTVHGPSHLLGARNSFVPDLGPIHWRSPEESHFHAYTFNDPTGKLCGYVRIPIYSGDEDHTKEFEFIIQKMQSETDCLVIDQVNNPGGSAFYLYGLLSMLTDRPLQVPMHRLTLNQRDMWDAIELILMLEMVSSDQEAREMIGDTVHGYPVNMLLVKQMLGYAQFALNEYEQGKMITDLYPLEGIAEVIPHPRVRYTKPILFLMNELDFSGGDFMPAILQDNHRAILFGARTAGAGGVVSFFEMTSEFGISSFTATTSYALRANGLPIENLGVTPDIEYALTQGDLENGYAGYKAAVLRALRSAKF